MQYAVRGEPTCSDEELLRMMAELNVDERSDVEMLRSAFRMQLRAHHSDRGGCRKKTKELTESFHTLKQYIELGMELPLTGKYVQEEEEESDDGDDDETDAGSLSNGHASSNEMHYRWQRECQMFNQEMSSPEKSPQATTSAQVEIVNQTAAGGDFRGGRRRRRFRHRGPKYHKASDAEEEDDGQRSQPGLGGRKFINAYEYTEEDYSEYVDPLRNEINPHVRKIRGGLMLLKDFRHDMSLDRAYEGIKHEDEIYSSECYKPILDAMRNNEESLSAFAEKMKAFVSLDWALAGDVETRVVIRKIKLQKTEEPTIYKVQLTGDEFPEVLSAGLHVDVKGKEEYRMYVSAVIESVHPEENTISLFFLDTARLANLLNTCRNIDISINASAFVYRSLVRSVDFVLSKQMGDIIFPKLEFQEPKEEFEARQTKELEEMDWIEGDGFNNLQKRAVHSIVNNANRPYPFILFGPPGTGKTVTLIETIRHLVMKSKNNRILVCTPSRMAADNFAETMMERGFIEPKYVFRMHSLSTAAIGRKKQLDGISYLPKEGAKRFFGIPNRLNLQLFRVIISTLSTSSYLISAGGFRGYFTHIFVDEAGQATEPETWIPIGGLVDRVESTRSTHQNTSVILAGDPKQLGPVINMFVSKDHGYGTSMLKRLIYSDNYENRSDNRSMVILKYTYRSHYAILRPSSYLFYNNLLIGDEGNESLNRFCSWSGLPEPSFPIIFRSSAGSKCEQSPNLSFHNQTEINQVIRYVEKLLNETEVKEKDIGIISPYKNQVHRLRKALAKARPGLTIDCVEGFQGSEREVIIISTVRTEKMGFLGCDLRLNTSISRAKSLLIVIGDDELLQCHQAWGKFIFYVKFHGGFINHQGVHLGKQK